MVPKVVDHEVRRAHIVAAMWRAIRRDGVAGTSVRTVAAEAGLSAGALRHYFTTQDELLALAVTSMNDEVARRVQTRLRRWSADPGEVGSPERLDRLTAVIEEVAPLDARRRAEFEVWLELVMLARTSPGLRGPALEAHRAVRLICGQVVLAVSRDLGPDEPADAAERDPVLRSRTDELHGLLDGLSLHLTLYPRETSAARVRAALRGRLEAYASSPVG